MSDYLREDRNSREECLRIKTKIKFLALEFPRETSEICSLSNFCQKEGKKETRDKGYPFDGIDVAERKRCLVKNGNRVRVKALSNFSYTHLVFENRHVDPRIKRLEGLNTGKFGLEASKRSLFAFFSPRPSTFFFFFFLFFRANQSGSLIAFCCANWSLDISSIFHPSWNDRCPSFSWNILIDSS